jgi:hypothetical protein
VKCKLVFRALPLALLAGVAVPLVVRADPSAQTLPSGFTVQVDDTGDDGVFDADGNELADLGPDPANLLPGTPLGTKLPSGFTLVTNDSGDLAVDDASGDELGDLGIPGNPTATNPTGQTGSTDPSQSQTTVVTPDGPVALGTAVSYTVLAGGLPAVDGVPDDPTGSYPLIPGLFFTKAGKPRLRGVPFDKHGVAHPRLDRKTGKPRIPGVVIGADGTAQMAYPLLPNGFPSITGIDLSAAGYPFLPNLALAPDGTLAPHQTRFRFQNGRPVFALDKRGFPVIPGVVFGTDGSVTYSRATVLVQDDQGNEASVPAAPILASKTLPAGFTSVVVPPSVADIKDPLLEDETSYRQDVVAQKTDIAEQRIDAASTRDKDEKKADRANIAADRQAIAADRQSVAADRTEARQEVQAARVATTAIKALERAAAKPPAPVPATRPPKKTKTR